MTLAPIRGAPPGAPNPPFPIEEPKAKSVGPPTTVPASADPPQAAPQRQRGTPVEIRSNGNTLTFRVIVEIPAIMRASMTIHVATDLAGTSSRHTFGFLRMSAGNARKFLTDVRDGRSPIVATGDEGGTVQISYETTDTGSVFSLHIPSVQCALRQWLIDPTFDMNATANELLADLGA